jgi:hypothetical protein
MRFLAFIILFPLNSIAQDALLEAIYGKWDKSEQYEEAYEDYEEPESSDSSEAEVYNTSYSDSWKLGTPDNIPEIEIIYEDSPCRL